MKPRNSKPNGGSKSKTEPSLLDQLNAPLRDFVADFKLHGKTAMEKVREESPSKYLELATKLAALVATLRPEPSGFSTANSHEEIAIKLLEGVGTPRDAITPDMIEAALAAHDDLVERLGQIAQARGDS
jgi:hypothetical protein